MSGIKGRSGRRKPLGKQIDEAMKLLDAQLPTLISKLITKAYDDNDREALIYLIDRRLGKPKQSTILEDPDGEALGVGLVTKIYEVMAERRRELDTPKLIGDGDVQGQTEAEGIEQAGESEVS